jgi:hypothetical protein
MGFPGKWKLRATQNEASCGGWKPAYEVAKIDSDTWQSVLRASTECSINLPAVAAGSSLRQSWRILKDAATLGVKKTLW